MKITNAAFATLFLVINIACDEQKDHKNDEVNSVDRAASIETELSVKHNLNYDILLTKHKIWRNQKLVKEIIKTDTIPSLGDTISTAPDANGNEVKGKIRKDYEFYITVQ